MHEVGVTALGGEPGYTTLERLWTRPTCEVNGLLSGYTGEGAKTVLPAHLDGEGQFPPGARPGPAGLNAGDGTRRARYAARRHGGTVDRICTADVRGAPI